MIRYDTGGWLGSLTLICDMRGSVIPKALGWAILSAAGGVAVNINHFDPDNVSSVISSTWFSFNFLLSFLLVFRTQSAYSRYWEGASTLWAVKADLQNAASCMFAFCSSEPDKKTEVEHFQNLIVRLMSLLHCAALQQLHDDAFDVIDFEGLSQESIQHLSNHPGDKALIILQWVQKCVVINIDSGVLPIAPPIATRIFAQLGAGVIQLAGAKKIETIPFPFPYTQMVMLLLTFSTCVTPVITGLMIESPWWTGSLTFVGIFGFWAINYIATEIENPFGDDRNDLPIAELQVDFNNTLSILMKPLTQFPPSFDFSRGIALEKVTDASLPVTRCSTDVVIGPRNFAALLGDPKVEAAAVPVSIGLHAGQRPPLSSLLLPSDEKSPSRAGCLSLSVPSPAPIVTQDAPRTQPGQTEASANEPKAEPKDGAGPEDVQIMVCDEAVIKKFTDLGLRIEEQLMKMSLDVSGLAAIASTFSGKMGAGIFGQSLEKMGSSSGPSKSSL